MRFAKCLAKTYLSFLASGAGTATGVGLVAIGVVEVLRRQSKPIIEVIKTHGDENDNETPTEA